jgi:G3E family GTPase
LRVKELSHPPSELPVTILTGFLGAGKTTLVNRLLSESNETRIGVLVNEFGQLAIDSRRLVIRGAIVELLNGCICCAAEGDLMRGLNLLIGEQHGLDTVLIETSGLADPWPVMHALSQWRLEREVSLWSVVTVVDAENFDANLERAEAAFQQLTAADLIVINKCDLVEPTVPALIARSLGRINPGAKTIATTEAQVPIDLVVDRRHQRLTGAPAHVHDTSEHGFQSAVVRTSGALDPYRFESWLESVPSDIYRMKGLVQFNGDATAMTFDRVGSRCTLRAPIDSQNVQGTEIVIIGRRIDADALQAALQECVR